MHDAPVQTGLYVGNIPLHAYPESIIDDKIAHAFNHSTRKTLSFIAPTMQNGEVVVRPSLDAVRNGSKRWKSTAVGYFLGKRPYYHNLKEFAHSFWPALREPLYPDAITRACTRLDFARVCVMIDATQKLHNHIIVMAPDEEGGETPCKVDVEYEWLSPKCTTCMSLGHSDKDCALNKTRKPMKPTVNVYVPKINVPQPQPPTKGRKTMKPVVEDIPKADAGDRHVDQNHSKQDERGKAIVIYNAFDALHLIDDVDEHSGGPNTSSPMDNDPC
ncbi:UNVERIFIED_CONTAM: hypothetical protein Sindi_1296400 [Sesamum indicum]